MTIRTLKDREEALNTYNDIIDNTYTLMVYLRNSHQLDLVQSDLANIIQALKGMLPAMLRDDWN